MSYVWANTELEPIEKLVMLAIADFSDDNGLSWPSLRTLSEKSSLSEDTVRRKLKKLMKDGLIRMTARLDKSGRNTSYQFQILQNFPPASPNFSNYGEGSTLPPLQTATLARCKGEGSTQPPSYIEPSINHQKTNSKKEGSTLPPLQAATLAQCNPPPSRSLFDAWNENVAGTPLSNATAFTSKREQHCRARLKERPLEKWREIFRLIASTPFLCGQNDRGWKADFDWITKNDDSAAKILEGKYVTTGSRSVASTTPYPMFTGA